MVDNGSSNKNSDKKSNLKFKTKLNKFSKLIIMVNNVLSDNNRKKKR